MRHHTILDNDSLYDMIPDQDSPRFPTRRDHDTIAGSDRTKSLTNTPVRSSGVGVLCKMHRHCVACAPQTSLWPKDTASAAKKQCCCHTDAGSLSQWHRDSVSEAQRCCLSCSDTWCLRCKYVAAAEESTTKTFKIVGDGSKCLGLGRHSLTIDHTDSGKTLVSLW